MVWLMAPSRSQDSRRMWETHSRNSLGPENVQVMLVFLVKCHKYGKLTGTEIFFLLH